MAAWNEFADAAPELAEAVRRRFDAHVHKTIATLRADGSPRISGTEVTFLGDHLWLGAMPRSVKLADLIRDARYALHSGSDDPSTWTGDAKVAGRAVHVENVQVKKTFLASLEQKPPGEFGLFRLELSEAVVVRLGEPADHLLIESWHEGRGVKVVRRE